MVSNIGPIDVNVNADAASALFNKIGPAIKNQNVKAIAAYKPGSGFLFPEGAVPAPIPSAGGTLEALGIPISDFMKLTKIPIIIYYG